MFVSDEKEYLFFFKMEWFFSVLKVFMVILLYECLFLKTIQGKVTDQKYRKIFCENYFPNRGFCCLYKVILRLKVIRK